MNAHRWITFVVLIVILGLVIWGLREERRHVKGLEKVITEVDGKYVLLAGRFNQLLALTNRLAAEITGDDNQPSTGRHAHTGEHPTTPIGGPR